MKCLAHKNVNQRKKGSSQYHKGHDGSIITCAFFNPRWRVPNGYIAFGWLLVLQEQIKDIIIIIISSPIFVSRDTERVGKVMTRGLATLESGGVIEKAIAHPTLP